MHRLKLPQGKRKPTWRQAHIPNQPHNPSHSIYSVDIAAAVVLPCPKAMVIHATGEEVTDMPSFVDATEHDMSIDASCRLTGTTA